MTPDEAQQEALKRILHVIGGMGLLGGGARLAFGAANPASYPAASPKPPPRVVVPLAAPNADDEEPTPPPTPKLAGGDLTDLVGSGVHTPQWLDDVSQYLLGAKLPQQKALSGAEATSSGGVPWMYPAMALGGAGAAGAGWMLGDKLVRWHQNRLAKKELEKSQAAFNDAAFGGKTAMFPMSVASPMTGTPLLGTPPALGAQPTPPPNPFPPLTLPTPKAAPKAETAPSVRPASPAPASNPPAPKASTKSAGRKKAYGVSGDDGPNGTSYQYDRFEPLYYGARDKSIDSLINRVRRFHQAAATQGMTATFSPYRHHVHPDTQANYELTADALEKRLREQASTPGKSLGDLADYPYFYGLTNIPKGWAADGKTVRHPIDYAIDEKLPLPAMMPTHTKKAAVLATALSGEPSDPHLKAAKVALDAAYDALGTKQAADWEHSLLYRWLFPLTHLDDEGSTATAMIAGLAGAGGLYGGYRYARANDPAQLQRKQIEDAEKEELDVTPPVVLGEFRKPKPPKPQPLSLAGGRGLPALTG